MLPTTGRMLTRLGIGVSCAVAASAHCGRGLGLRELYMVYLWGRATHARKGGRGL